jgi:hypothetical protein
MNRHAPIRDVVAALFFVAVAGCSSAGGATPVPATSAPVLTPSATAAAPTPAGPTAYADWVARQGFGGSSGLNNVAKLAGWLTEHRYDVTAFDLDGDHADVVRLVSWLDAHPATPCWVEYHATVRSLLQSIADAYVQADADLTTAGAVDATRAAAMSAAAAQASALPAPASCP